MRRFFWFTVFVAVTAGISIPAMYFYYSRDLPDLDSAQAVKKEVGAAVESQRRAVTFVAKAYENVAFELVLPSKMPKALIGGMLALDGCPDYLTARKERGYPYLKRLFHRWSTRQLGDPGPAACHMLYADQIATAIGIVDPLHSAVADYKIHSSLSVEELLAYRASANFYSTTVIGAPDAARALFKKELSALTLWQLAELIAAESAWPEYSECRNPSKLKMWRDNVLDRMEAFRVISPAEAKTARLKPVTCTLTPG